jgi:hypothetical protein
LALACTDAPLRTLENAGGKEVRFSLEVAFVEIRNQCATIKDTVAVELQGAVGPGERVEILVAALYEISRSVLPSLGTPRKSRAYLENQEAVLGLISFVAIQLIRGAGQARGAVAVLSEIGEGCLDPLLKKKLSVYAQELLAKSDSEAQKRPSGRDRGTWLLGLCAAAVISVFLGISLTRRVQEPKVAVITAAPAAPAAAPSETDRASSHAPSNPMIESSLSREHRGDEIQQIARLSVDLGAPGERTTRVRIVNNHVLVPVTVKNDGNSLSIELVLDTGATRTSVHEDVASRLGIDLRFAGISPAEVADGRVIHLRIAQVDSLAIGPFVTPSVELEFIPYNGSRGTHDGLLGMDFLGKHRYQIDMEHELIRWF